MKDKELCCWCGSSETFLLGAREYERYWHCRKCGADYIISLRDFSWTNEEVEEHNKLYKQKIEE